MGLFVGGFLGKEVGEVSCMVYLFGRCGLSIFLVVINVVIVLFIIECLVIG